MQHRASVFVRFIAAGCAAGAAAGCAVGAPPGFSGGEHWTIPLVGPLEDGVLFTVASVRGHGPYLFAIDPDANVSAVDRQLVDEAELRMGTGPHRIDETNIGQARPYAELFDLTVANLKIDRRDVMVFPVGFYDTEARHVRGILGRDALADSLVFGFDRDHGIATLTTRGAFKPPPDAIAIRYDSLSSESSAFVTNVDREQAAGQGEGQTGVPAGDVIAVPRRIAPAQIGGRSFTMHLDLGAATSQLAEAKWAGAGLVRADVKLHLVDEAATSRDVAAAGIASEVTVAGARTFQVTFAPYVEKRFKDNVEGALGLDFFRPYAVYANWDARTYFLKQRDDLNATTVARLGRWGAAIPVCSHPGCITADIAAQATGVTIDVVRDPLAAHRGLEVFLGVAPAPGKSATPLVVELPDGADQVTAALPPDYAGAALTVLDVAPFARACPGDGGCVLRVGASSTRQEAPAQAAPGAVGEPAVPGEPARTVLLDKLHRVTGAPAIPPNDEVVRGAAGTPIAVAIVKLCLDRDGAVATTKILKSSGVPAYDDQLQAEIKATWTFSPVQAEGQPQAVCTTATFLRH